MASYSSELWQLGIAYIEIADNFNPEVGFLRRTGGFRKFDFGLNNTSRPNGFLKFQELSPHMSFTRFWNLDGDMETSVLHLHFDGEFEDSSSGGVSYDIRSERVFSAFTVSGLSVPPCARSSRAIAGRKKRLASQRYPFAGRSRRTTSSVWKTGAN